MGALNEAYNFLYTWLWGSGALEAFEPYAECITIWFAVIIVGAMVFFLFMLVTSLVKLIYYMFGWW